MEPSSLKRTVTKSDEVQSSDDQVQHSWNEQGACKRPRLEDYRESVQESDDEGDDDNDSNHSSRSVANLRAGSDNEGSFSFSDSLSGLSNSGNEDVRLERRNSRWIVRKDSTNPSISSVITELSDSEITSAIFGQDDATCDHHRTHHKSSQPIDSVIRNMESWSVTHIRALRRNNVYENNRLSEANTSYRTVVNNAKRDVMRLLRRTSGDNLVGLNSNGNSKDDASSSNFIDNKACYDRCPSPMDEL